jgi:glutathione S-transferase
LNLQCTLRKGLAVQCKRSVKPRKGKRMPYKLYGRPGAGSAAVEALLALLGVAHDIVDVAKNDNGTAPDWYLRLNPRGEVPTLALPDGSIMTESAAMMIHLCDCHPEAALAPPVATPARAQFLRWMVYLAATPYATDLRLYYPERYSTDPAHAPAVKAKASADLARDFAVLDQQMGAGPFLLGKTLSAADIYAAMLLSWSDDMPGLFVARPKLQTLYKGVASHPAITPVWRRNGVPSVA